MSLYMTIDKLILGVLFLSIPVSVVPQTHRGITLPQDVIRQLVKAGEDDAGMRTVAVDLNDDGRSELIVQASCSTVGNCSTWVFRKSKDGYQQLLIDNAQIVRVAKTRTYGYRDIVFQVHDSAYRSTISTYKFDGEGYHLKRCIFRDYSYIDKKGRFHIRNHPSLERC